ncbi:MAG: hypothetical protein LBJ93_03335 [Clostridiales bacterium]|nr:hypothetical protein [Clostridiales bacterium]
MQHVQTFFEDSIIRSPADQQVDIFKDYPDRKRTKQLLQQLDPTIRGEAFKYLKIQDQTVINLLEIVNTIDQRSVAFKHLPE